MATFFGSAAQGLGFFHVSVPTASETAWLNFSNFGIVNIRSGSITLTALESKLSEFFCKIKQWPWQIREIDENNFLVRFPPWKQASELIELPPLALEEEKVTLKFLKWDGDVDAFGELIEAWVLVEGIPPKM
jgi:hypothetical protein